MPATKEEIADPRSAVAIPVQSLTNVTLVPREQLPPPSWLSAQSVRTAMAEANNIATAINRVTDARVTGAIQSMAPTPGFVRMLPSASVLAATLSGPIDPAESYTSRMAVLGDIAVAADIVSKHDPAPGSLEARYFAEETGNVLLADPPLHELWRNYWLGSRRMTDGVMPYVRRDQALELTDFAPINVTDWSFTEYSPFAEPDLFWNGNFEPSSPTYHLVKEVLYGVIRDKTSRKMRRDDSACCSFQNDANPLMNGEFYRSPTFVAKIGALDPGVYGETYLGKLPFEITVSNRNVDDRTLVSFVHETLHGYDELYKLGIDHNQLHGLSVYLTQEVIPGFLSLKNKLQKSNGY